MARRSRRIRRYRKSRYSPNIQEFSEELIATQGINSYSNTLCTNPSQSTLGVSQTYTVKNFEISFTFECGTTVGDIEDICAYIMYKPQGMDVTETYNLEHPEYILSYKYYGSPLTDYNDNAIGQTFQPMKIKTRMARRLQTGDSIILFIKCRNDWSNAMAVNLKIHGIVRWWSKAN